MNEPEQTPEQNPEPQDNPNLPAEYLEALLEAQTDTQVTITEEGVFITTFVPAANVNVVVADEEPEEAEQADGPPQDAS